MKASNIPYSILSLEAILEMAIQCGDLIAHHHTKDKLLDSSLTGLDKPIQRAILAVGRSRKQELTGQIREANHLRDRAFIGFRKRLEADRYYDWNPSMQKAANNLLGIIKKHGTRLHKKGQTVQSALLTSLFDDLADEQAKADLEALKLNGWVTRLKQTQSDFALLYQQRNELEAEKDLPTRAEAKDALVKKLSILLDGLHFLATTRPGNYAETNIQVDEIISRIVTSERGRRS